MTPQVRMFPTYCYIWVPERDSPLGLAKFHYEGPYPTIAWSLPQFTDPENPPTFPRFPAAYVDATREFLGLDLTYVTIQKRIYYRSRFHQGNHWLRLEF